MAGEQAKDGGQGSEWRRPTGHRVPPYGDDQALAQPRRARGPDGFVTQSARLAHNAQLPAAVLRERHDADAAPFWRNDARAVGPKEAAAALRAEHLVHA